MVCNWSDLSSQFNAAGKVQIDTSSFDYILVQVVTPAASVSYASTNDAGAIQGATDGNATSALNFVACQGTNLTTGTAETSSALANSIHKFNVVGRFLQISGTTAAKVLVGYCSISS